MKRTHLPLNALRVLDAAARHVSFTRAADELAVTPAAQSNSSLSDQNIEFTEAKVTLQSVTDENARLQEQVALSHQQIKSLTESLAIANLQNISRT